MALIIEAAAVLQFFRALTDEFKNALPNKGTNGFLATLKNQAGKIEPIEFRKYVKGTFTSTKIDLADFFTDSPIGQPFLRYPKRSEAKDRV